MKLGFFIFQHRCRHPSKVVIILDILQLTTPIAVEVPLAFLEHLVLMVLEKLEQLSVLRFQGNFGRAAVLVGNVCLFLKLELVIFGLTHE